jgi:hypothetical protein
MNRDRRSISDDGMSPHTPGPSSGVNRAGGVPREDSGERFSSGPLDTPRRYDQPIEKDDDPVMPADDATLNTKI